MTTPMPTATTGPASELAYLTACYHQLRVHVRDVHGIDRYGTAGQIEAAHIRAHDREGSAWHDAWTIPLTVSHSDLDHDREGEGS